MKVLHKGKQVQRQAHTIFSTLCGRSNARSRDGMNIADKPEQVTCKLCLRAITMKSQLP